MYLLKIEGISKAFGGVQALKEISFNVEESNIVGVIGPNGAGKSTLFNIITGVTRANEGKVVFAGHTIHKLQPEKIAALGVARTFQLVRIFKEMTVLENVVMGRYLRTKAGASEIIFYSKRSRREEQESFEIAKDLLGRVGLDQKSDQFPASLPYGQQRLLEVVRALASEPRILLLDEPAAGLNAAEGKELVRFLQWVRNQGVTIVLVEHDMKIVMSVCDRLVVLDYGEKIAEGRPEEIRRDKRVIEAYLGGNYA